MNASFIKRRGVRWIFLYAGLLVLGAWTLGHATPGPLLSHADPALQREFKSVYDSINNPKISSGTAQGLTLILATISSETVITSSITNLSMQNNKITSLANGTASSDAAAFGQIHLLQSPVCFKTSTSSSTSTSSFAKSNLAATITPVNSGSTIMIWASSSIDCNGNGNDCHITIWRGTTNLAGSGVTGFYDCENTGVLTAERNGWGFVAYDTPGTTSATTYTVAFCSDDATKSTTVTTYSTTGVICLFETL